MRNARTKTMAMMIQRRAMPGCRNQGKDCPLLRGSFLEDGEEERERTAGCFGSMFSLECLCSLPISTSSRSENRLLSSSGGGSFSTILPLFTLYWRGGLSAMPYVWKTSFGPPLLVLHHPIRGDSWRITSSSVNESALERSRST